MGTKLRTLGKAVLKLRSQTTKVFGHTMEKMVLAAVWGHNRPMAYSMMMMMMMMSTNY
jgi:hypothetical protein